MPIDVEKFKGKSKLTGRYEKQLARLQAKKIATDCVGQAVSGAVANLKTAKQSSLIVYGERDKGGFKIGASDEPAITQLGPYVLGPKRHFVQRSTYTV
jgi:hypothetical protein